MVLNAMKRRMTLFGVLPTDSTGYEKLLIIIFNCFIFSILLSFWISTSWYLCFEAETQIEYTEILFFVTCSAEATSVYLLMFRTRYDYNQLFKDLDFIVEKSKYTHCIQCRMVAIQNSGNKFWINLLHTCATTRKQFKFNQ